MTGSLRPLRIVHCFRSPVGGIFRHVRDLAQAQARAGHQVGIICDSATGGDFEDHLFNQMQDDLALGLKRIRMQRHIGTGDISTAVRIFNIIKELKPDILHGHGSKGGVYARLFGSLLRVSRSRVARLYSPHGGSLHFDEKKPSGRTIFLAERLMERFTDTIIFVSDYEKRAYIRKVGPPACESRLVYNGLNDADFAPIEAAPDAADFLYIGMMRDLKGGDLFINALAEAEKQLNRPLTALMIGDGPQRSSYIAQAEASGLGNRITFKMPIPAREAFGMGRVVVIPSRAEAMPYIVLETLAAGLPIIASRVGGIPEILGVSSPALVLPDANLIASKMVEAATDLATYARLMPSPASIRERFGSDVMATAIEATYRESLA
ncbi:MAG: glycosyltransferase family 4 protein [Phyllobacterium sp.]